MLPYLAFSFCDEVVLPCELSSSTLPNLRNIGESFYEMLCVLQFAIDQPGYFVL